MAPVSGQPGELPSGDVTFLLTDIEGSAALWDEDAGAMARTLKRHDELLAEVVGRRHGVVVKRGGADEATLAVFARASDAAGAAAEFQRVVTSEPWPGEVRLLVRIGLHTGEAIERGGDYIGPTVNRAARLRSLARGGQILVSQATAEFIHDRMPEGAALVHLGRVELRGLSRAEEVSELVVPTLAAYPVQMPGADAASGLLAVPLPGPLAASHAVAFVGRDAEREVLLRCLKQAREGERRVAFLSGEPGIGKTRLASEVAKLAHADGAVVLYGHADRDLGVPYQPWTEALSYLIQDASPALLSAHVAEHGASLARIAPGLSRRVRSLPPRRSADPDTERYLLWTAVIGLLASVSRQSPLLLVLDDLHWADAPTVQLLRHTATVADLRHLFIVATYRHSELGPTHSLTDVVAGLRRHDGIERIRLDGLGDLEVLALLENLGGQMRDESGIAFAQALRRDTNGNPFFTQEVLRHLTETGAIHLNEDQRWVADGEPDDVVIPASVREVVASRVHRLGDDVAQLLSVASVVGQTFQLGILAEAAATPEEDVLDRVEAAVGAALLANVPGQPDHFRFVHALIQHSLYTELSGTRRRRLHRRVAEALETAYGTEPGERVGELAHHWAAAAAPVESLKAIDYAVQAGQRALTYLAPDEANRWFDQALEMAERSPIQPSLRAELLVGLGDAQRQVGNPAYRQTLLDAAVLAETMGDGEGGTDLLVRAALANYRGFVGTVGGVDAERVRTLEVALAKLERADSPERARLLATLSAELAFAPDHERRLALADEAVAVAHRTGDRLALLETLTRPYLALAIPQALDVRVARTREAVRLAEAANDPVAAFWAIHYAAMDSLEAADADEMDRRLDRACALARRLGQPFLVWADLRHRSLRALLKGDAQEAERLATEAFQVGSEAGEPDAAVMFGSQLAAVRRHQGRLGELDSLLTQAAADNPGIPAIHAPEALAYLESGHPGRARPLLEQVCATDLPLDVTWLATMTLWAEVAAQLGDTAAAAILYERLSPWHDRVASITTIFCFGAVAHALAQLDALLGRTDRAVANFEVAMAIHERLGAPYFVSATKLALARVMAAGEPARARQLFVEAAELAARYGCVKLAGEAEEALGSGSPGQV
jgi:class 3 adenylate cyclase/tetratricopeptide (TPR) repeat protein